VVASHVVRDTELWLAEDAESELAGILVLDGQWLDQLYVEPTMTGRGVGSKLVELASARVRTGCGSGRSRPMWERSASTSDTISSRFAVPMAGTTKGAHRTFSTSGASPIADRRAALDPRCWHEGGQVVVVRSASPRQTR
jgi:GNAT superfamily N-acetyltransferase